MKKTMITEKKIISTFKTMQKLGQHFLKNKDVIAKIVSAIEPKDDDVIFEIGPGHGELTKELSNTNRPLRIICIEKDISLCESLKTRFKDDKRIEIVCGDALKFLPLLISQLKRDVILKYKVVGNIPYYITGHLFRIIGELKNKPERTTFMIQKEVAVRIVSQPPKMNRLAASVQFWAAPKIIMEVPKYDFHPAPRVDSAVVLLEQKKGPSPCKTDNYYAAVRAIFSQPRKTVFNNILNGVDMKKSGKHKKESISSVLKSIGIDPECRPQNLSIENIEVIAGTFF